MVWRMLKRVRADIVSEAALAAGLPNLEAGDLDTLDQIALVGDGSPMSEIAEGLLVDRSTASRAVDRLMERGLVVRERDPRDARMIRVSLTETGRVVQTDARERREALTERLLARLAVEDQQALAALAPKLAAAAADELGNGSCGRL